jgi:hypothetical protein
MRNRSENLREGRVCREGMKEKEKKRQSAKREGRERKGKLEKWREGERERNELVDYTMHLSM